MAGVYARFRGAQGWEYQKVGRGRPPKDAKFHIRFTDAQGKRRWSQPFNTPQEAQENAAGVAVAAEAATQGLTVAAYHRATNTRKNPAKLSVELLPQLPTKQRTKTTQQTQQGLS